MIEWFLGISAVISAVATVTIAKFAYGQTQLNERLTFYTGSMESYSQFMLMLAAEKQEKRLVWWDPTREPRPFTGQHNQPIEFNELAIYVPEEIRKHKTKAPRRHQPQST